MFGSIAIISLNRGWRVYIHGAWGNGCLNSGDAFVERSSGVYTSESGINMEA